MRGKRRGENDRALRQVMEALEFYADPESYEAQYETRPCGCCADVSVPIEDDVGGKARTSSGI